MRKLVPLTVIALATLATSALAETTPSTGNMKMTKVECETLWKQADSAGAGSLNKAQAALYVKDFAGADANTDGKLSGSEFTAACEKGMVSSGSAGSGAGAGSSGSSVKPDGKLPDNE